MAFGLSGVLFAISLALLCTLRVPRAPRPAEEGFLAQFKAGLRYVRRHAPLRRLVLIVALSELCFSGPMAAAVVLLVAERGWSGGTVGWILGAFSVGGAASGTVLAARTDRLRGSDTVLAASLMLTAALVATQGMTPRILTIGVAALLGAGTGAAAVLGSARLQTAADPRLLGRVTAVTTFGTLGLSPLLFPLVGMVAARWGIEAFFVGCAVVCLSAALIAAWPASTSAV